MMLKLHGIQLSVVGRSGSRPVAAVLLILAVVPAAGWSQGATVNPPPAAFNAELDRFERALELGAHQRLVERLAGPDAVPQAFESDGCSGGMSALWHDLATRMPRLREVHGALPPWQECCVVHDRAYHLGVLPGRSAEASFNARKRADLALEHCVEANGLERAQGMAAEYGLSEENVSLLYASISALMYRAVRLGGVPCSGLPWRWGFGWPQCSDWRVD